VGKEPVTDSSHAFSLALIALMKGVVYRENDEATWQALFELQARLRDHVGPLGLELVLDEAEGHAYLRQRPRAEDEPELPRLVARRPLGFTVSLLLALLRKRLAEFDATSGEPRLVLSRDEVADLLRLFMPDATNEARVLDRIDRAINQIEDLGFLRRLRGRDSELEVRRILKTFVDAQWLGDLDRRLTAYRDHLGTTATEDAAGARRKDDDAP
jgi:hypothetical protein